MRSYTLELKPNNLDKREMLRKIMLVVSIGIDLVAIGLFVMAIFAPLYFIGVALLFVLSNAIRYVVNLYPKRYSYGVNSDRLFVCEISPLRTNYLVDVALKDIKKIKLLDNSSFNIDTKDKNNIIIYDNSCQNKPYMILFNGKSVILPLDEYLYTLLVSVTDIEDQQ